MASLFGLWVGGALGFIACAIVAASGGDRR